MVESERRHKLTASMTSSSTSHLGTGWRDQWERVQRWHQQVSAIGSRSFSYDDVESYRPWAGDIIYAFFMNCYHLRDWLIKSGHSERVVVDAYIKNSDALRWCRDICNGMKHFRLDPDKTPTYESWTTATVTAVYIDGRPVQPEPMAGKHWVFEDPVSGAQRDMFELADACMEDWAAFLRARSEAAT